MDPLYNPDSWQPFFSTIAGVAATLTGLLFVGLSMNLKKIMSDPAHSARSRESLGGLLLILVVCILVLIPGQGRSLLGWELLVYSLFTLILGIRLQSRTIRHLKEKHRSFWFGRVLMINLATLLLAIGGVSLILGSFGGMLWLVPSTIFYIVWSTSNAWHLVTKTV